MKVLYNWLKEFVPLTATPEELRARLSLSGTAIEALEQTAAGPLLDAELTSNRADCLGHYGIARECFVYRHGATSKGTRIQIAQHEIGIGDRQLRAAAAITHRPGVGAGAVGTDLQQAQLVDARRVREPLRLRRASRNAYLSKHSAGVLESRRSSCSRYRGWPGTELPKGWAPKRVEVST